MCSRSLCGEVSGGMRGLRQANIVLAVYELDSVIVVYGGGSTIQFSYLRVGRKNPLS